MFAQLQNNQIIAITKGTIDPVQTNRICLPIDQQSEEWKDVVEKRQVVREFRAELQEIIKQSKLMRKSPMLKQLPKVQKKLLDVFKKPYEETRGKLIAAEQELARAGAAYKERRRKIYAEHAVYLAPGGCVPIDDKTIEKFKNLKPGQVLIRDGKVKKDGSG